MLTYIAEMRQEAAGMWFSFVYSIHYMWLTSISNRFSLATLYIPFLNLTDTEAFQKHDEVILDTPAWMHG